MNRPMAHQGGGARRVGVGRAFLRWELGAEGECSAYAEHKLLGTCSTLGWRDGATRCHPNTRDSADLETRQNANTAGVWSVLLETPSVMLLFEQNTDRRVGNRLHPEQAEILK